VFLRFLYIIRSKGGGGEIEPWGKARINVLSQPAPPALSIYNP